MEGHKKQLLSYLDAILKHQKTLSECHDYYKQLEKEFEQKKRSIVDPVSLGELSQAIETLNKEYEEKCDQLQNELNQVLVKGHDIAKKMGKQSAHDFQDLWNYMTDLVHETVNYSRVFKEVEKIKRDLL